MEPKTNWHIFRGSIEDEDGQGAKPAPPHDGVERLLEIKPPTWRAFTGKVGDDQPLVDSPRDIERGSKIRVNQEAAEMVNAALYLRRPLLVTGAPGSGKSSLAYAVAYELKLGPVLRWSITTRTALEQGLYRYDAVARLQEVNVESYQQVPVGKYIQLGPLGTALLPRRRPRVLLIDEIDKSDIDLPNDLLNIFEEGEFEIPELARRADVESVSYVRPWDSRDPEQTVTIHRGRVQCATFPVVIMTSNGEREFPRAFLRRCLRLDIKAPAEDELKRIVEAQLGIDAVNQAEILIQRFLELRDQKKQDMATDQLLNAIYLLTRGIDPIDRDRETLYKALLRPLTEF
jgi:MoxR-like ATPase